VVDHGIILDIEDIAARYRKEHRDAGLVFFEEASTVQVMMNIPIDPTRLRWRRSVQA